METGFLNIPRNNEDPRFLAVERFSYQRKVLFILASRGKTEYSFPANYLQRKSQCPT